MRKGFTLIEVLVVAVIVAILAAVAIPAYNAYIRSSKEKVALNFAATVAQSAGTFYSQSQVMPASLAELNINVVPVGYLATIGSVYITVTGDSSPGYVPTTDLTSQSVAWHN